MIVKEGTRLGRYEIRSLLGTGGMGEVYLALDTQLRRQVAIKLLPVDITQNKLRLTRFEREAYAASALNHPNILTIHEIGEQDGHHFLATEYIEGESLRQLIGRAPMELKTVLDITSQVASALAAAHQAGIVHRDIKPENVMVRKDGFVKVLDFGLAKLEDDRAIQPEPDMEAPTKTRIVNTEPGVVMGTAYYMSPEQARGLEVDSRTDIWSLGVMLYEMVSRKPPFEGATATDVISTILHREPVSVLLYRTDAPAELERIVEKALTKEREERYQMVKELGLDSKRLKQRLDIDTELERSITPEAERQRSGQTTIGAMTATSGMVPALSTGPTPQVSVLSTVSSAEYLLGEIKRHKRGAVLAFGGIIIAAVAATFAYYMYSVRGRSAAIDSIAVLPFANISGDPNMEYISDGISESLINTLSQLPQIKVIARSSAFKYKGKEIDPQEVAKALGVQAIVMGRVTQRGDNLQVSAEMVNALDKSQVWGEQFSRKVSDIEAVQQDIARSISDKLRLRLTGSQQNQLTKHASQNPQAYQLYLNGRFYSRKGGRENVTKALEYQNQAVALDPDFALAWAALAGNYTYFAANSFLDPEETMKKARLAAERALALDETLAEAHSALANIKMHAWDWSGAEREYKRALELNSNLAGAHSGYSVCLSRLGRYDEAISETKRAQELDPLRSDLLANEGQALYFARRYDEAIQKFEAITRMESDSAISYSYLGYNYAAKGMYPQAIAAYQKALAIDGENSSDQCYLAYALAQSGKKNEAQLLLDKLKSSKDYVSPAELAIAYLGLGDKEGGIASLEKAYAAHDLQLQFLKTEPYDSVRSDPRVQELVRKVFGS